jgi:hypothetical protein
MYINNSKEAFENIKLLKQVENDIIDQLRIEAS